MFLLDNRIPVDQCMKELYELVDEEDSTIPAYGVYGYSNNPSNLKTNSSGSKLPHTEPIFLEYNRESQTVKFTSKNFDYIQSGVPKDITFAIGVGLGYEQQKIEAAFLYLN